jgi:hypothetical protein
MAALRECRVGLGGLNYGPTQYAGRRVFVGSHLASPGTRRKSSTGRSVMAVLGAFLIACGVLELLLANLPSSMTKLESLKRERLRLMRSVPRRLRKADEFYEGLSIVSAIVMTTFGAVLVAISIVKT